jgi:FlaA1/EpsC-like NDP-sugar epimerase
VAACVFAFYNAGGYQGALPKWTSTVWIWAVGNVALTVFLFSVFGLYKIIFHSVGIMEIIRLMLAICMIAIINFLFALIVRGAHSGVGPGVVIVYVLLLSVLACVTRYFQRIAVGVRYLLSRSQAERKRVMIVGGGEAGTMLIKEMQTSTKIAYKPVCIADDNLRKVGMYVCDVKIAGTTYDVKELVEQYHVQEIFITIPSLDKKQLSQIVARCQQCGCPVRILPGIYQLATGNVTVSSLRDVEVSDLLGREQVEVNLDEVMGYIENKTVLVTGGGGSIGSELCRQIATHNPKMLIILDIYENNAYEIEQELKRKQPDLQILTLIASVREERKMRDVFEKYRPQIVFHAAAHKHVPLMEDSPCEAVKNNVFGTWNVAKCADAFHVETFVLISTDKAVNPTNIMGATKRICEMIIQTIGKNSQHTKFVAVRFGNVLGSNGSVIPLFRQQIKEGGPVTVTHKDIIRYFMTIPEAVSLVLQAGAYAKGGQIFVLDMGEPVKIYDLAYNLIKLSGLEPNVDIDIVCTGLRPGEKLYEERLMKEEGLMSTPNGLINIARPIPLDEESFFTTLDTLCKQAFAETEDMKTSVKALVPTYTVDKRSTAAELLKAKTAQSETTEQVG